MVNEVKSQLNTLRSNHNKKLKKMRKRDSDLWSTKIIDIKVERLQNPQIIVDLSSDIHIFNTDIDNTQLYPILDTESAISNNILPSTELYPQLVDGDLTTNVKTMTNIYPTLNNTANSFESLFAQKSEIVVLNEENIRVIFDYDIVHHLLDRTNTRNDIRVADCIRVIKQQLMQWKIAEERIQWSAIRQSFNKRLSTIQFSDRPSDNQQITFLFKLKAAEVIRLFM
ncbi:unnamed protein product [Didymodactylos carnosus]|uniref:Uncharacterized protein n=1 Tax=Didymodactylos carnosus TaxID=1234261 RepID=A0A814I5X1_9BILA|nr:unnamed protein product [Didymodactylos carnosus]CAF3792361.1 unnamed protein product [Didymodactylos carnosus]